VAARHQMERNSGSGRQFAAMLGGHDLVTIAVKDQPRAPECRDGAEIVELVANEKPRRGEVFREGRGVCKGRLQNQRRGRPIPAQRRNGSTAKRSAVQDDAPSVDLGLRGGPVERGIECRLDRSRGRGAAGLTVARILDQQNGETPASGIGELVRPVVDQLGIAMSEEQERRGTRRRR